MENCHRPGGHFDEFSFFTFSRQSGVADLVSSVIPIPAGPAQLSFRHSYNMESGSATTAFDGGVLDIKMGAESFTDIVAAGGSFITNGYAYVISSSFSNSLGGRQAWSGNSGGFVTTVLNLPATASSQNVQFRWRCGSDQSFALTGWHVDTLALNGFVCCGNSPDITAQPQNQIAVLGGNPGFNVTATGSAPLMYQWQFTGTNINGATGSSYARTNAQYADTGAYDVVVANSFGSVTSAVASLSVVNKPSLIGPQKPAGGNFSLTLVGTPGYNYAIDASTNLSNWVLLGTLTNANGRVQFTDPGASNYFYRFYRARIVP